MIGVVGLFLRFLLAYGQLLEKLKKIEFDTSGRYRLLETLKPNFVLTSGQ
jgi:hypothetical protein